MIDTPYLFVRNRRHEVHGNGSSMNTKHIGDTSEAMVISQLIRRGYSVSIPFGDNDPYDIIVDSNAGLYRVQVKTGWIENGCIRFKTYSQTTDGGDSIDRDYTAKDVDVFAVRCRDTDKCYWVPVSDTGKKNTYLRVEDAHIDHPRIKRADTFGFDTNLPSIAP
ncbi:MAG: group I intron-associated PD-(D/E)XK endonuclease [Halobacteriales archaeon]